jgi:hypothetical protein
MLIHIFARQVMEIMGELPCETLKDVRDVDEVTKVSN